jgi:uncharacterized protein YutE (UPF0331/DUF86 family)
LENEPRPHDSYERFLRLGEIGVLPIDFARHLAPLGGFRNILVHEYLAIDWQEVFDNLQQLDELAKFAEAIRAWMSR